MLPKVPGAGRQAANPGSTERGEGPVGAREEGGISGCENDGLLT